VSRTALCAYAVAAALLLGATMYMVDRSHAVFREECRRICDPIGMDFRVRAVPRESRDLTYPARCDCVARLAKRWWEVWK
jgi:hypothetical protein